MKLKQIINGGALAATVLSVGPAQNYDGIGFCKVQISEVGGADAKGE